MGNTFQRFLSLPLQLREEMAEEDNGAAQEELAAQGTSSPAATPSQVPQAALMDASRKEICPICQDSLSNTAFLSPCWHSFCLPCILQWGCSHPTCPLCRGRFSYICQQLPPHQEELHPLELCRAKGAQPGAAGTTTAMGHHRPHTWDQGGGQTRDQDRLPKLFQGQNLSGLTRAPQKVQSRSPRCRVSGHPKVPEKVRFRPSLWGVSGCTRVQQRVQSRSSWCQLSAHPRVPEKVRFRPSLQGLSGGTRAQGRNQSGSALQQGDGHTGPQESAQCLSLQQHLSGQPRAPEKVQSRSPVQHPDGHPRVEEIIWDRSRSLLCHTRAREGIWSKSPWGQDDDHGSVQERIQRSPLCQLGGHARAQEKVPVRSQMWDLSGCREAHPPPGSRRQGQDRAQDAAGTEGRSVRPKVDITAPSERSEHQQGTCWDSSRE
ncbi:uncharacterized protein [Heliangelus exortis]|uniref:uncharacterized protein isoform X2 n=1 Tax=Heliangelus exortis TaxID=472823 RepID=UPI003A90FB62